ncbi:MAG: 4Fe-4S binding protein [Deltaproteobacteria bacterium]|nr:4Fe-4S binding protein [Deltaproteobacteria bacterium]
MAGTPCESNDKGTPEHYVQIDSERCNGCVLCMKACPTKAIRVRGGKARIEGICIDCGECLRVCPNRAIKAVTTGLDSKDLRPYTILLVSPVLYTQFGEGVMPNDILLALWKAFGYVFDLAYANEVFNAATELTIRQNRTTARRKWPLISPICPVVNRIIKYRFPSLLGHILPVATPREFVARALKKNLSEKGLFREEDSAVVHVTPCSAKMMSISSPLFFESSNLDGVLGITEIFETVRRNLGQEDQNIMLHWSSGVGIGWNMSGGEIAGLESGRYLAVSGIQETMSYLEKIEMGLLAGIEYVEFRACPEGCIGGPMTVADKYQAKHTVQRLRAMYGLEKRMTHEKIRQTYMEGLFFTDRDEPAPENGAGQASISSAIEKERAVDRFLRILPGKECGACGSPDCRTFAEDVIDGRASPEECVFSHQFKEKL